MLLLKSLNLFLLLGALVAAQEDYYDDYEVGSMNLGDDGNSTANSSTSTVATTQNTTTLQLSVAENVVNRDKCPGFDDVLDFTEGQLLDAIDLSEYSTDFRPIRNTSNVMFINVSLVINGLLDFNVQDNRISFTGYFRIVWMDEFMRWDKKYPENCLQSITLPAKSVWTPDLSINNHVDGSGKSFMDPAKHKVKVENDGKVIFTPSGEFSVKCEPDITFYPRDEQICSIAIESTSYDDDQVLLNFYQDGFNQAFTLNKDEGTGWVEHPLWDVLEVRTRRNVRVDGIYQSTVLAFSIRLRRLPLYYNINIVVPGTIIATIAFVVFALPIDAVGKFGFAFTCLLAYTVFNSMIMNDIPRSSTNIPIISLYIYLQMACITVIIIGGQAAIFMAVAMGRIRGSRPPRWMLKAACAVKKDSKVAPADEKTEENSKKDAAVKLEEGKFDEIVDEEPPLESVRDATIPKLDLPEKKIENESSAQPEPKTDGKKKDENPQKKEDEETKEEWHSVARLISRISMCLYIAAVIINPCVILLALPKERQFSN